MPVDGRGGLPALAVLILARDEADVLERTLPTVTAGLAPGDTLHVVADHCRDATAAVARRCGATVHIRDGRHGEAGKGESIRWWLDRTAQAPDGLEPVVVLDADSLPEHGFFDAVRRRLSRGELAVQALIEPGFETESGVAQWAAFSELVEQRVWDRARAALGWPVRLRGTGMAFARPALDWAARGLSTAVEDVELTLTLAARGVNPSLAVETWVRDPKPPDTAGAVRQRARWLRGQVHAARAHAPEVGRLMLRGPAGWSLLSSLFLKPKAFVLPLKVVVVLGTILAWLSTRGEGWLALAAWTGASLVFDGAGLLWGLRWIDRRAARLRLLASIPQYGWIWLRSLALSAVTRERWLRSRPVSAGARTSELPGEP